MPLWGEEAWYLPIGVVWDESNIILVREHQRRAQEAVLMQTVIASVLSKSAGKDFKEAIGKLNEELVPHEPKTLHEYMTWELPTD